MEIVNIDFSKNLRQAEAYKLMFSDKQYVELLYGGAKGGGKSVFMCYFIYLYTRYLIDTYNLKQVQYPPAVGFFGRKQAVNFNITTLATWKKMIPAQAWELKEQKKEIIIEGRASVLFGGLDDQERVQKFQSAEFAFACLDQAEEVTADELALVKGSLKRFKLGDKPMKYRLLLTANPKECHLKNAYLKEKHEDRFYIPALPIDNGYLEVGAEAYRDHLIEIFKYRPELVE